MDEEAQVISARAAEIGLDLVQLHGDAARSAFKDLPRQLDTIYVVHAGPNGSLQLQHRSLAEEFEHLNRYGQGPAHTCPVTMSA